MKETLKNAYAYAQTIPDRVYPFATEMEGKFVRGRESYKRALEESFLKYGPNHFGFKLTFYRGTFHLLGSIVFILMATFLSKQLLGGEMALYALMFMMIVGIFIQEFYWQPRQVGQLRYKGIVDTLTWVMPMLLYLTLL
jgi:VIT1/CCC1 family predicted Fe2+/Mn2+ transporter